MSTCNWLHLETLGSWPNMPKNLSRQCYEWVGANQPVHWFLGDKGLGIQQGRSVWVGSPKSYEWTPT